MPGVVTYLDLRGLESGPHLLVAERKASESEKERRRFDPADLVDHVPFWR